MEGVLKVGIGISSEMGFSVGFQGEFQSKASAGPFKEYNTAYERHTWMWLRVNSLSNYNKNVGVRVNFRSIGFFHVSVCDDEIP